MHSTATIQRSRMIQTVKNDDKQAEALLRKELWQNGIRYRKNYKVCSCKPNLVLTKYKIAIFCDEDFWQEEESPDSVKTRNDSRLDKLRRKRERDLSKVVKLLDNNWIVLRFWESDIQNNLTSCVTKIITTVNGRKNKMQKQV